MARRIADKALDSRAARSKLTPRIKPYWRSVEKGLHLGYCRGSWIVRRRYAGRYQQESLGIADDLSDADGVTVLSYWQASDLARIKAQITVRPCRYTVAQAIEDHLQYLKHERKGGGG